MVNLLHAAGARRFLFLAIPPAEQSPLVIGLGSTAVTVMREGIRFWNDRLVRIDLKNTFSFLSSNTDQSQFHLTARLYHSFQHNLPRFESVFLRPLRFLEPTHRRWKSQRIHQYYWFLSRLCFGLR